MHLLVKRVSLSILSRDLNGPVLDPEVVLLNQQRHCALQNARVIGVLDIVANHLREERWLRSVEVVDSTSIGNETNLFDNVQEVLDHILGDFDE